MLEQLKIENFRCFKYFEIGHLSKVNLIVGKNNGGKTTILEAIRLFNSQDILSSLKEITTIRGESIGNQNKINITHVFNSHYVDLDKYLIISGINSNKDEYIKLSIDSADNIENTEMIRKLKQLILHEEEQESLNFKTEFKNTLKSVSAEQGLINIPSIYDFSTEGEIIKKLDFFIGDMPLRLLIFNNSQILKTKFISSSSLTPQESLKLFNQIVLTPEEDLVYQALQIIEPNIERIAPIGNEIKNNNSRSGFFVRLKDTQKRIPIGSMGDGIWRMLGLSLALVSAKDGVLLVDEIDTGLHYTALEDMWKLIWETSKKLNVQVFATTHNSDCWKALEALTSRVDVGEEDISIQRIEKDAPRSVAYNKEEIATAVERETEVR
ncbi:MAG: AAA family ATPase [Cyanobacteria bacterium P01_G01_bin.39]